MLKAVQLAGDALVQLCLSSIHPALEMLVARLSHLHGLSKWPYHFAALGLQVPSDDHKCFLAEAVAPAAPPRPPPRPSPRPPRPPPRTALGAPLVPGREAQRVQKQLVHAAHLLHRALQQPHALPRVQRPTLRLAVPGLLEKLAHRPRALGQTPHRARRLHHARHAARAARAAHHAHDRRRTAVASARAQRRVRLERRRHSRVHLGLLRLAARAAAHHAHGRRLLARAPAQSVHDREARRRRRAHRVWQQRRVGRVGHRTPVGSHLAHTEHRRLGVDRVDSLLGAPPREPVLHLHLHARRRARALLQPHAHQHAAHRAVGRGSRTVAGVAPASRPSNSTVHASRSDRVACPRTSSTTIGPPAFARRRRFSASASRGRSVEPSSRLRSTIALPAPPTSASCASRPVPASVDRHSTRTGHSPHHTSPSSAMRPPPLPRPRTHPSPPP
ncbi:MAG: hypothetical protein SGPRY_002096 [Prymnesium sp.]